ncbi:tropomyosin beta chain-like [Diplodia corticola]|uniref:Tropomyosin beta chain-like n=1 Tax=Diplodia corticola TaxID=236234 RepID=A0A1J9RHE3_9PEZI|nr:tropomyosin beta chain-like [Diplodia corticola]OJD39841.1 tropomyosin beta chain-like [Diplodia corticola]
MVQSRSTQRRRQGQASEPDHSTPEPHTGSRGKSFPKTIGETRQRVEEAEKRKKELENVLGENAEELSALNRFIQLEKEVAAKRKDLEETEKQFQEAWNAISTDAQASGQPTSSPPSTGQPSTGQPSTGQPSTGQPSTGQPSGLRTSARLEARRRANGQLTSSPPSTRRPSGPKTSKSEQLANKRKHDMLASYNDDEGDDDECPPPKHLKSENPTESDESRVEEEAEGAVSQTTQELDTAPLPGRCGEWSEKRAEEILGDYLACPLVQTTLNYLESDLSEQMIEELRHTLDTKPGARLHLKTLRRHWGGRIDYFQFRADEDDERAPLKTLSWNKYQQSGHLVSDHRGSGPEGQKRSHTAYKKKLETPLFGYGEPNPEVSPDCGDPKTLTTLYQSFLRTTHASDDPCFAHTGGLLGSQDRCHGCGILGYVEDLD